MPYASVVNALDATDGNLYIGGSFNSSRSNQTYQNIVEYDTTTKQLVALQGTGTNGAVTSLLRVQSDLYVGGSFTGLVNDSSITLNNVALYSVGNGAAWYSLGGGVNGPVRALHQSSDNQTVIVSGNHTACMADRGSSVGNATSGNAWWDIQAQSWSLDTPYISGAVHGVFSIQNGTSVFVGDLKAAQRYQSRGFSYVSNSTELLPLPVYPDASQSFSITAGAFWNDLKNGNVSATIVGGTFQLDDNIQNVAIQENGSWTGIGADWSGNISAMVVNDGYLYIGGTFEKSATRNASSFLIYDLVNKTFAPVPDLHSKFKREGLFNVGIRSGWQAAYWMMYLYGSTGWLACKGQYHPIQ